MTSSSQGGTTILGGRFCAAAVTLICQPAQPDCHSMGWASTPLSIAGGYRTEAEFLPDMGHVMRLGPGWQAVAETIDGWLTAAEL